MVVQKFLLFAIGCFVVIISISRYPSLINDKLLNGFSLVHLVSAQYQDPSSGDPDPGGYGEGGSSQGGIDSANGETDPAPGDTNTSYDNGAAIISAPGSTGPSDSGMTQPTVKLDKNSCDTADPAKPVIGFHWDPNPNTSAQYFEIWRSSTTSTTGTGFHTQIYDTENLNGTFITRHDQSAIDFNWGGSQPDPGIADDWFSIRFEGYIKAPATGNYTFSTSTPNGKGSLLKLDYDQNGTRDTIIDDWTQNQNGGTSSSRSLQAGKYYLFELRYWDSSGNASVNLSWSGPGVSGTIPASAFYLDNSNLAGQLIKNNHTTYSYSDTTGVIGTVYNYWVTAVGTPGVSNSGLLPVQTDRCPKPTMLGISDACVGPQLDQAELTVPFTSVSGSVSYRVQRNYTESINHFNPDTGNTLNDGIISYWKGGPAGAPAIIPDVSSSNPAEAYGGLTLTDGKILRAATFNGTASYLRVENNDSINLNKKFSIGMWIKPDRVTGIQGLFTKFAGASDKQFGLSLDGSSLRFDYGNGVTNNPLLSASGIISAGAWQFVVATVNGDSNRIIKIYLNGNSTPVAQTALPSASENNSPILMGRWNDATQTKFYQGQMDEISFWGKALNTTEIADLYNEGNGSIYTVLGFGAQTLASAWPSSPFTDSSVINNRYYSYRVKSNFSTTLGKINSAGGFDGVDNMVTVPGVNASLKPATALTISAWVKTGSISQTERGIITKRFDELNDPWNSYSLGISGNSKFNFCISNGTAASQTCIESAAILSDVAINNIWTHLIGTYDGTNMKLYVNNNSTTLGATGTKTGSIGYSNSDLRIGCYKDGSQCFGGYIDDARVYNTVLTPAELATLYNYNGTNSNIISGLTGWWKMDEASWLGNPGEVIDSSGSGNNGTAANGAGIAYNTSSYAEWTSPWYQAPSCDTTPPTANFNLPRACYSPSTWPINIDINVSDSPPPNSPSGISLVQLKLVGPSTTNIYDAGKESSTLPYNETWRAIIPADALAAGQSYILSVRAVDKAGNPTGTQGVNEFINPTTFSYAAACVDPWLQTTGGDVHTNSGINVSGP